MTVVYGGAEFPAYVIDEETLREELLDEDEAREWCEETPQDPHAVSFWRMLGELDRALTAGQQRLFECDPGSTAWASAAMRLAQVHHWRREYGPAHEYLDDAELVLAEDEACTALLLSRRATAFFDQGCLEQAREAAAQSLALRQRGADAGQITSGRMALARIERALAEKARA